MCLCLWEYIHKILKRLFYVVRPLIYVSYHLQYLLSRCNLLIYWMDVLFEILFAVYSVFL